jgi:hypothetical protein
VAAPLAVGDRVRIEKGFKGTGSYTVAKGTSATVTKIEPLGAEHSHAVKVTLKFLNGFNSGKTFGFYARHMNRLSNGVVSMNDGRPEHRIEVTRQAKPAAAVDAPKPKTTLGALAHMFVKPEAEAPAPAPPVQASMFGDDRDDPRDTIRDTHEGSTAYEVNLKPIDADPREQGKRRAALIAALKAEGVKVTGEGCASTANGKPLGCDISVETRLRREDLEHLARLFARRAGLELDSVWAEFTVDEFVDAAENLGTRVEGSLWARYGYDNALFDFKDWFKSTHDASAKKWPGAWIKLFEGYVEGGAKEEPSSPPGHHCYGSEHKMGAIVPKGGSMCGNCAFGHAEEDGPHCLNTCWSGTPKAKGGGGNETHLPVMDPTTYCCDLWTPIKTKRKP